MVTLVSPAVQKVGGPSPQGPLEVYAYEICQAVLQYPHNLQSYSVSKQSNLEL